MSNTFESYDAPNSTTYDVPNLNSEIEDSQNSTIESVEVTTSSDSGMGCDQSDVADSLNQSEASNSLQILKNEIVKSSRYMQFNQEQMIVNFNKIEEQK